MSYENALDLASAHVTDILAIVRVMGKRGIRVDTEKLAAFNLQLDAELAVLQQQFDADLALQPLRGFHPKEGYKKVPKNLSGMVQIGYCPIGAEECIEKHGRDESGACKMIGRWAKLQPFLATSSQQVKAYALAQGHKLAVTKEVDEKGQRKTTTGAKALALMWRRYSDSHYRDFVEYRKLKKMRGTYGEWRLVERNGCHYATTTYTLVPETNRLSSKESNGH